MLSDADAEEIIFLGLVSYYHSDSFTVEFSPNQAIVVATPLLRTDTNVYILHFYIRNIWYRFHASRNPHATRSYREEDGSFPFTELYESMSKSASICLSSGNSSSQAAITSAVKLRCKGLSDSILIVTLEPPAYLRSTDDVHILKKSD